MSTQLASPPSPAVHQIPETRPRSRRKTVLFAVALVVAIGALAFWLFNRNREGTDDAEVAGHISPVSPRVSGTVVAVNVNDNQPVHQGGVLFRLDDRDYRAALEQAQANLAAAQAAENAARTNVPITRTASGSNVSSAGAGLLEAQAGEQLARQQAEQARARLAAAQANLVQARANAQRAQSDERRYAQLVTKDEVSRQQYETAATTAAAASAQVDAMQAQVVAAQRDIGAANAQIEVARGKIAQAQANVQAARTAPEQVAVTAAEAGSAHAKVLQAQAAVTQAQLNLDYTVVRAPLDGLVGNKHIEVGQTLSPGQQVLAVVPVNDVWVVANYKETQLQKMRPGQQASVSVDAFSADLKGRVDSIGSATGAQFSLLPPENATGNYVKVVQRVPVKIVFDQGQNLSCLRPGMSVEATIYTK